MNLNIEPNNTVFVDARNTMAVSLVVVGVNQPKPNLLAFAASIVRTLLATDRPNPTGVATVDHSDLEPVLKSMADGGLGGALSERETLKSYLSLMSAVDPDSLSRDEALAYWINLYNAAAADVALRAFENGEDSILRVAGAFTAPVITVGDEHLSLDGIEHGKVRRFGDPRIHGALVCGSLSCPTLRPTPFTGMGIDEELDDQMRYFLANGGAVMTKDGIELNRIFRWYGADFVRPGRMPSFLPVSKRSVLEALAPWLPDDASTHESISFSQYDWGLACQIG